MKDKFTKGKHKEENTMSYTNSKIIGIDHGFGFTKTKNSTFQSGVAKLSSEPPIKENIVYYNGKYYQVGVSPEGIVSDKTATEDYYILTLAAIAEELKQNHIISSEVTLAVGIPLTRYGAEKDAFKKYLSQNEKVTYLYEGKEYHINIDPDVFIYPQGYAAILPKLNAIKGSSFLVDIGTGTTEILPISGDKRIDLSKARSMQWGVSDAIAAVNEEISRQYGTTLLTDQILDVMLMRETTISPAIADIITGCIKGFCDDTLKLLRQNKVNYEITQTFFMGGGAGLLKKYGAGLNENSCIHFIDDIRVNAIGYEILAAASIKSGK